MEKVGVFIDGGYLQKELSVNFDKTKIDYSKLPEKLSELITPGASGFRTYFYDCQSYQGTPPTEDEKIRFSDKQRFLNILNSFDNYEVRLGRLARYGDGINGYHFRQKQVDILLAIDLVRLSSKQAINHAILIAGDSDFVPAIKYAKDDCVNVHLLHGDSVHYELSAICDTRHKLDNAFINTVKLKNNL